MLSTAFAPSRYTRIDWEFNQPTGLPHWLIKPIFRDARIRVLDELHRLYFDSVELFDIPRYTNRWIANTPLLACASEAGKLYLILDHFSACLPLPRRMRRLAKKNGALFQRYFDQRSLDNLQANLTSLLQALAILSLIPDAWFPEKTLEEMIEHKIQGFGLYRQVHVDCQLNLPPGGLGWLAQTTLQSVQQVRAKLALGQPCLVRMLRSLDNLCDNRQVVVYACDDLPGGCQRLEIFEPNCVLQEHALQVNANGEIVQVFEIAPPGRPLPVLGLLHDAYSPVPPPALSVPRWLRHRTIRKLWWEIYKP